MSEFGSQLSVIAFPLLVLALGGRATQAGAVATCSLLTRTVLRLPAGHLADRVDRRRVMVGADLARLVAVGSIPVCGLAGLLSYPQLLVVAFVEGTATAMFAPASRVALRDVVAREQLAAALGRSQATTATVSMVGPVLGGALFGVDRILPFALDAASYLVSAVLLLGVPALARRAAGPTGSAGGTDRRVTAGVAWLWHRPVVMRVLLFASVINFAGAAAEVAVLIVLRQRGTSVAAIGVVMACAGVGAVAGALLAGRILGALPTATLCVLVGLVWTGGFLVFAAVTVPWVTGALLVVMMLFAPAAGIALGQLTLGEAPADILGRVTTAEQTVSVSMASVGPILAGVGMQVLGVGWTWSVLAGVCLLAVVAVGVPVRSRRTGATGTPTGPSPEPADPVSAP